MPGTYVYGPVPSRRFGLSLGLDIVPHKHCSFDCLYCQLGPTRMTDVERQEFVPVDAVMDEVERALAARQTLDVVTVAGSGEPTLHSGLGLFAQRLRLLTDVRLLLITNGSLLWNEDVAQAAALFDIVAPSLDAGDEKTFRRVNRPHHSLDFAEVLDGIARFTRRYPEKVRLEVFIAAGLNDSPECVDAIIEAVKRLDPRRVDLNTAVRPSPGRNIGAVSPEFLAALAPRFHCPAMPVVPFSGKLPDKDTADELARRIVDTLARRPCTLPDLAIALGNPPHLVAKALAGLLERGLIREELKQDETWFVAQE